MGQLQFVMGEAGWPDPGHPALTSHGLPAPADLLQIVIVIINNVPKAVHRPLRFLQLREEDSLLTPQRGDAAPQRGAGRGRGSAPTWDSSSSSSSKVKARNLELCQYSSSSARALLICNGAKRPQRRSRPVPQSAAPRRRHSPPRAPLPPQAAAQQRHGTGGRAAAARGTPGRAVCTPPSARSRVAVGLQVPACTARLRAPGCDSRLSTRGGAGSGPLLAAAL